MSRSDADKAPLLGHELAAQAALHGLMDAACAQVRAQFPRSFEHGGRRWWLHLQWGLGGVAVLSLFNSPAALAPTHCAVTTLGGEFGHSSMRFLATDASPSSAAAASR